MTRDERKSIRAEILALIDRIWKELGRRGSQEDVRAHLRILLSDEQHAYLEEPGLASIVGGYFRQQGEDGLPQAPEIDEYGTHCQLELLSVDEFRYIIRKYMERSKANKDQARRAATLCHEYHGVWIDPDSVLDEDVA